MSRKKAKDTITAHNIKNSNFRQVHVDGAHGTITPSGLININFFSQRNAIPKSTVFALSSDGKIGKPIEDSEDSKEGVIREFEFGTIMDINVCISLKNFLEQKIEEYESLTNTK